MNDRKKTHDWRVVPSTPGSPPSKDTPTLTFLKLSSFKNEEKKQQHVEARLKTHA